MPSDLKSVFLHFQNLNLLALLQDLRAGRTTRQSWLSGSWLCPVAHGMPHAAEVRELRALGQADELEVGCKFAARQIGADPDEVLWFVRCWDEQLLSDGALVRLLEEIWSERLNDAVAAQEFMQESPDDKPSVPSLQPAESSAASAVSVR